MPTIHVQSSIRASHPRSRRRRATQSRRSAAARGCRLGSGSAHCVQWPVRDSSSPARTGDTQSTFHPSRARRIHWLGSVGLGRRRRPWRSCDWCDLPRRRTGSSLALRRNRGLCVACSRQRTRCPSLMVGAADLVCALVHRGGPSTRARQRLHHVVDHDVARSAVECSSLDRTSGW